MIAKIDTKSRSLLPILSIGMIILAFHLEFSQPILAKDVSARESDRISLKKRKQAVFQLVGQLNRMSNPSKESLESLFKRELKSKRLGFYESDVQSEIDMKSFQVSYGRNGEIVCANIYLQQNLNLQLADAKKHFGNYQTKFSDSLFIDNKSFPVLVYSFNKKGKKVYFSFLKKNSQAVEIHVSFE